MIGLGLNATKTPTTNTNIVRSVDAGGGERGSSSSQVNALVLRHDYKDRPVEPVSSGAASFDQSGNDSISMGDPDNLSFGTGSFSVSCWANSSQTGTTRFVLAKKANSAVAGTGYALYLGNTGQDWVFNVSDGSDNKTVFLNLNSNPNQWYHLCGTFDGVAKTLRMYLDGVLVSTDSNTNIGDVDTTQPFQIGIAGTITGSDWDGYVCNVGVWSEVLTQPQIKSIMNKDYAALSASEKTNLVSWWNLDSTVEDLGTAVYDNHNSGLGSELINNGSFETNLDGWTTDWWQWNALGAYHPVSGSHKPLYQQAFVVGEVYLITFDINVIQGSAKFSLGTNTGNTSEVIASALGTGSYSYVVRATYEYIVFNRNNGGSNNEYYVNNVSVKLINGNPGTLA